MPQEKKWRGKARKMCTQRKTKKACIHGDTKVAEDSEKDKPGKRSKKKDENLRPNHEPQHQIYTQLCHQRTAAQDAAAR